MHTAHARLKCTYRLSMKTVSRFPECGCLKDNYFLIREHNFANNESRLAGVRPLLFANYYGTFKKIWKLKKKIASVSIGNKTHAIHPQHNKPYTEHNSEVKKKIANSFTEAQKLMKNDPCRLLHIRDVRTPKLSSYHQRNQKQPATQVKK